ncbi:hypothetical protein PF011_g32499 [Phytophthora fragariae]|uniref:Uncharacterized protein n=1 Tax=Phytophthora fragariae TaxID=53985 RepID=A0A6A3G3N5_9STRA|nr:hypothetical protein PF011_g32499 [Phytophthora fragariae]
MSAPISSERAPGGQATSQASSASAKGSSPVSGRNSGSGEAQSPVNGSVSNSPLVVDVTADDAPGNGNMSGDDAGGDAPDLRGINNVQPVYHISASCLGTRQPFILLVLGNLSLIIVTPFSFRVTFAVVCLEAISASPQSHSRWHFVID